jgi:hypothetical protein
MPQRLEPKLGVLSSTAGQPLRFTLDIGSRWILTFSDPNRWTRIKYVQRSGSLTEPLSCRTLRIRW